MVSGCLRCRIPTVEFNIFNFRQHFRLLKYRFEVVWEKKSVLKIQLEYGEIVDATPRKVVRKTVTQETSAAMREMLYNTRRAYRANGTDKAGYYIGGKTGTAQVIKDGEYSFDETVATYIGFGGTEGENPAYVIMVRVWEDGKTAGGEAQALPVFNVLNAYVQDYLKIKPSGN